MEISRLARYRAKTAGNGIRENMIFAATALIARGATAILSSGFRLW